MQTVYETLPSGTIDRLFSEMQQIRNLFAEQPKETAEFLTRNEACALLNITRVTIWTWAKNGKIPTYKIGGKILLKRAEVLELVQENKTKK